MRKETQKIMSAFLKGESASAQRTNTDGYSVWLHGNLIAERGKSKLWFTLADWPTVTTRERINGMLNVFGYSDFSIGQKHTMQWLFHNGKKIRSVGEYEIMSLAELDELRVSV